MGKLLFVIYSDESIPKNKDQRIRTTKIGNLKQTSQQLDMKKHVGVPEQLVTLPGSTSRVPPTSCKRRCAANAAIFLSWCTRSMVSEDKKHQLTWTLKKKKGTHRFCWRGGGVFMKNLWTLPQKWRCFGPKRNLKITRKKAIQQAASSRQFSRPENSMWKIPWKSPLKGEHSPWRVRRTSFFFLSILAKKKVRSRYIQAENTNDTSTSFYQESSLGPPVRIIFCKSGPAKSDSFWQTAPYATPKSSTLSGSGSFGYTPPTFGEGLVTMGIMIKAQCCTTSNWWLNQRIWKILL